MPRSTFFLSALLMVCGTSSVAQAHGRPPFIGELRFHPTDPNVAVARATWGLVVSEDGGDTWRWICAAAAGVDATREDPSIVVMPDGSVLMSSFSGLVRSTPDRCAFDYPSDDLVDAFVIDVHATSTAPERPYAVRTDGAGPDSLWRSPDMGNTWEQVGEDFPAILLERVRVAPSDPDRIYLSGAIPMSADRPTRQAFLVRSDDGGASFERTEVPLEDGERNLYVLAVDPTSADRLLLRVTRRFSDTRDERLLLSEDGGRTFTAVMQARNISDATFSEDGASAYVSSATLGGLYRSEDAGLTFGQLTGGNLLCVETRGNELWTCANELADGYSLATSENADADFSPRLEFGQVYMLPECPECSPVGYICPQWFPDLAFDLELDATAGGVPDGGVTGGRRDAAPPAQCRGDGSPLPTEDAGVGPVAPGGCGCVAIGSPTPASHPWLALLAGLGLVRASGIRGGRRRRGPPSSS